LHFLWLMFALLTLLRHFIHPIVLQQYLYILIFIDRQY